MKYAKSILMGIGSVVLAGLIMTLLVPKAVHAVVATAVQVMNTSATPVPNKDVDEPARTAYTATCQSTANTSACATNTPPGKIFVIETISAVVAGGNYVQVNYYSGGALFLVFFPLTQINGTSEYVGTVSVRLYADPNTAINCGSQLCTYSGHLVSTP